MVGNHRCDTGVQVYLKQDGLSALGSWTDLSVPSFCSWCIVGDKNSTLLSLFCYCISKHDDWKSIHVQKQCISILKRCICVCLVDRAAFGPERRHSAPLIFAFFRIVRSEPFRRTYVACAVYVHNLHSISDLMAKNFPPNATTWPPPRFSPPHQ